MKEQDKIPRKKQLNEIGDRQTCKKKNFFFRIIIVNMIQGSQKKNGEPKTEKMQERFNKVLKKTKEPNRDEQYNN